MAEFNRKQSKGNRNESKHTGVAVLEKFNSTKWFQHTSSSATKWGAVNSKYAEYTRQNKIPMHIMFYENLKVNSTREMETVLEFLENNFGFRPDEEDRRLKCLEKENWQQKCKTWNFYIKQYFKNIFLFPSFGSNVVS